MTSRRIFSLLCLLLPMAAGCDGDPVNEVSVDDLSRLMGEGSAKLAIFDANGSKIRKEFGIIPGAKMIDDAGGYDLSATLPGDKASKLVFYCSSTWCSAAGTAAKRARAAGYPDVNVLAVGIKGWKAAGKPTSEI